MTNQFPDNSLVKELSMGFCLGMANIIPGVSGGTFLLIFKIYERVFAILDRISRKTIFHFMGLFFSVLVHLGSKNRFMAFNSFLKEHDFLFLLKLTAGAAAAILGLSSLMKYLLLNHFSMTYSLFFGLIMVSVIIPVRMLKARKKRLVFWAVLGAALTVMISGLVNPYDKVKMKSDHYRHQYEDARKSPVSKETGPQALGGRYSAGEYAFAGLCGAVSISAMVLPGISGSLVLILMGAYFDVISAISSLRYFQLDTLMFLGAFGLGLVVGGLLFAKLINFVLKRFYDTTMAFLTGLMAGSLYALWPFKEVVVMARQYVKENGQVTVIKDAMVYTNNNILPHSISQAGLALVFFTVGCGVMYAFIRAESQK